MIRTLRWQILVPRLLVVVVALLAVQYLLGIAAQSWVVRSGQAAVGVPMTLDHARVSMFDQKLVLSNLRITSPFGGNESLVEADRGVFYFEPGPILRKRAIVEHGVVAGLRFVTPRRPNGALSEATAAQLPVMVQWTDGPADEAACRWLARVAEGFQNDVVSQFESVRRAEENCARWPQDFAALDNQAQKLKRRVSEFERQVREAESNPLRHAEFFKKMPGEAAALQREFEMLGSIVEKIPDALETERRAIIAARRNDERWLRDRLRVESIEAAPLNAYLLRARVAESLNQLIGALRWARQVVPAGTRHRPKPRRGDDIFFAGLTESPNFLVRELRLKGTTRIGGQPVELRGMLTDFTTAPALHGRPIRLRLVTAGSLPLELQATIDRTTDVPCDKLLVDCHGIIVPKMELGNADALRLSLAPSVGSLSISVSVTGDTLAGDVQLVQKQVQIAPALGEKLAAAPLAAPLTDTLGDVSTLAIRLSLSGTLSEPKCSLWSNLGPAVAESMERALHRAGEQHTQTVLANSQRRVDEALAQLERKTAERQRQLRPQLARDTGRLERVSKVPKRLTVEQLGRRLPETSLFR